MHDLIFLYFYYGKPDRVASLVSSRRQACLTAVTKLTGFRMECVWEFFPLLRAFGLLAAGHPLLEWHSLFTRGPTRYVLTPSL